MSLRTVKIFTEAMEASTTISEMVGGRIFPIAFPGTDEEFDNLELPYIIIGYEGPNNTPETKDDIWEGSEDHEQIFVMLVASNVDQLADVEDEARKAVTTYFSSLDEGDENYGLLPDNGLSVQGDQVLFNPYKPDYFHTLTYQCQTPKPDSNE